MPEAKTPAISVVIPCRNEAQNLAFLIGEVEAPEADDADYEDEPEGAEPDVEPVGDADLLADLGVPAKRLLELCAREGMLPPDVTAEICLTIGCGDEIEELREE